MRLVLPDQSLQPPAEVMKMLMGWNCKSFKPSVQLTKTWVPETEGMGMDNSLKMEVKMSGMSCALATISVLIKACVNSRYQATFHPLGTRLIQSIIAGGKILN